MSRILDGITLSFPALKEECLRLSPDELSDSRLMAELASHIVNEFEAGHSEQVLKAFELAEFFLVNGSEPEKYAAIVGFLETVQNAASHRMCGISVFEPYLGLHSREHWEELIETWKGKSSLAEVVTSETGAEIQFPWWKFWRKKRQSPRELLDQVESPELRKIIEQITRE